MGKVRGLLPIERAVLSTCTALLVDDLRAHDNLHVDRIRRVLAAIRDIPLRERPQIQMGPLQYLIGAADDFCETFVGVNQDTPIGTFRDRHAHFNRMRRAVCRFFVGRSDVDLIGLGLLPPDQFEREVAHG